MSYTSNYNLNIRLSALENKVASGGGGSGDLDAVLTNGNSAGSNDIDMNNNDILLVDNIDLTTINGAVYPPVIAADTLSAVLTAGNIATNSITVNNNGAGTNVINLLPNASATNPTITLTDGTITNTIDKNGITTRNSVQNSTHFLNFSDVSTTGVGAVQKTAGLSCNPSTNIITATSFVGDLTGNATTATRTTVTDSSTTVGTFNPVFSLGSGTSVALNIDNGLTFIPSTNTLTTTFFSGSLIGNANTATDTTNVLVTTDNTAGTYYLPYVKTSATGNKPLFIDDTITALTYNPNTSTISCASVLLTSVAANPNAASRFSQVGLVRIGSVSVAVTGTASPVNISFSGLFVSSYKSYRIILEPSTQLAFAVYPSYSLQAFLGTGSVPTIANLAGFETISTAPTIVSPVFTAGATISATPLLFSAPTFINSQTVFEIENVGFTYAGNSDVALTCNSVYNNTVTTGSSTRTISATAVVSSSITGLVIQQSAIGVSNNFTLVAQIFGMNQL